MKVRKAFVAAVLGATASAGMPAAGAHTYVVLVAGGVYTGVIVNSFIVTYACTAAGVGDIVSVAITECHLTTSPDNLTIAMPGPTATIGGTATVPFAEFRLCYTAVFTFTDSHTATLSGCNSLAPSVGAVPRLVGVGVTTA